MEALLWHPARFTALELRVWDAARGTPGAGVLEIAGAVGAHRDSVGRALKRLEAADAILRDRDAFAPASCLAVAPPAADSGADPAGNGDPTSTFGPRAEEFPHDICSEKGLMVTAGARISDPSGTFGGANGDRGGTARPPLPRHGEPAYDAGSRAPGGISGPKCARAGGIGEVPENSDSSGTPDPANGDPSGTLMVTPAACNSDPSGTFSAVNGDRRGTH